MPPQSRSKFEQDSGALPEAPIGASRRRLLRTSARWCGGKPHWL